MLLFDTLFLDSISWNNREAYLWFQKTRELTDRDILMLFNEQR